MKFRDKVTRTLLISPLVLLVISHHGDCLTSRHVDQEQRIQHVFGDPEDAGVGARARRDTGGVEGQARLIQDKAVSSAFHLNNSHLHLMVHWAGKDSSIVFCLARDQVSVKQTEHKNLFCSIPFSEDKERFYLKCIHIK